MFTGLVEDVGSIVSIDPIEGGVRMRVRTALPIEELSLGDSIAVDGTCLTAVAFAGDAFDVELSEETLRCTRFGDAEAGEAVNLERALRFGDRLGGHRAPVAVPLAVAWDWPPRLGPSPSDQLRTGSRGPGCRAVPAMSSTRGGGGTGTNDLVGGHRPTHIPKRFGRGSPSQTIW